MEHGGGFCDKHGPYDPPHQQCPFCAAEQDQRRAFGPPDAPLIWQPESADEADQDADFVRATIDPAADAPAPDDVTRVAPRTVSEGTVMAENPPDDASWLEAYPEPLGWLIVKSPDEHRGTVLPIQPNQTIGRQGDVSWSDPRMSRQHARFTFEVPAGEPDEAPVYHLWPFGPANPVHVNGESIRGATPLSENDEIQLGDTVFVFKVLVD